jgi:hypothetical protein
MLDFYYTDQDNNTTIFIPIAACQEYFIEQTVRSALTHAHKQDRIFFGIFNNILDKEKSLLENEFITSHPQIFYVEAFSKVPLGIGHGRMNASLLSIQDFDFMFQIDAHTIFSKNWDVDIINNYRMIESQNKKDKFIISCMPAGSWNYNESDRNTIIATIPHQIEGTQIYPYNNEINYPYVSNGKTKLVYDGFQGTEFSPETVGIPITYGGEGFKKDYEEVNAIHASFMFSKFDLIRDVLHDPKDPFDGDQVNYMIRLISRGYKIFSTKTPVIFTLNKYINDQTGPKENSIPLDKEYNWRLYSIDEEKYMGPRRYFTNIHKVARENYKKIINGEYFGYWGAPNKRALEKLKKKIDYPK